MTSKEAQRYARYAEAVRSIVGYPSETMVNAVMAVADAELQERERSDPLVGRLVVCTEPTTGRVIAVGRVAEVERTDRRMDLTVVQYESPTPTAPNLTADPALLLPGMNWRDHLGD